MRVSMLAAAACVALTACRQDAGAPDNAETNATGSGPISEAPAVPLVDGAGKIIGEVRGGDSDEGAVFEVVARELPPGVHGMHLHSVGRCEGPKFESAGPHWNPTNAQHGTDNPRGPHFGDLPNITVGPDGTFRGTVTIVNSYLDETRMRRGPAQPILDADGSALVIHAAPDDNRTDPSGNSGDRIACAALAP